jgi:decaprenyl-phosphate phosphoribosyltransferase
VTGLQLAPPPDGGPTGPAGPARRVDVVAAATEPPRTRTRRTGSTLAALLAACRPKQWLKNALVVGAPLASGRWAEGPIVLRTTGAFVAFCLVASAVYLVNDVMDAEEDRRHPRKRFRPVASGRLAPVTAAVAAAVAVAGGTALAWVVRPAFAAVVVVYLLSSLAYSIRLRREPVLEFCLVALGFLLRAAGGGIASGIPISSWFLLVAGFGSLYVVAGKRFSELVAGGREGERRVSLGFYSAGYLRFVWGAAATVTVAAYALWADEVYRVRAGGAWALMSLFPFAVGVLVYARAVDTGRAEAPEDVVLTDRMLQLLGLVWLAMVVAGSGGLPGAG